MAKKIADGYKLNNSKAPRSVIFVRGKIVTGTVFEAYVRRLGSTDDTINRMTNAAVLELVLNENYNWFNNMFKCDLFRLEKGGLNKLGMEVFEYVQAHFPRAVYDKDTGQVGVKKWNADSPLAKYFVSVGDTCENADLGVKEINGAYYRPFGDFALTFQEYKALMAIKKPKDDEVKPVTAKAFIKSVENAVKAQAVLKFTGTPDEMVLAMAAVETLVTGIKVQLSLFNQAAIDKAAADLAAAETAAKAAAARLVNVVDMTDDELAAYVEKRNQAAAATRLADRKAEDKVTKAADDKEAKAAKRKQAMLAKAADVKGAAGQSAPLANVG